MDLVLTMRTKYLKGLTWESRRLSSSKDSSCSAPETQCAPFFVYPLEQIMFLMTITAVNFLASLTYI